MTFVPLTQKNFVVNKINNTIKIDYKDSDIQTHVCDKSIDSKSLINLNNFVGITNKECNVLDTDAEANSKKNRIKSFYSSVSNNEMSAEEYFEAKSSLNDNSIFNDNIKEFNFKNYFKVERIDQKFLPNSFELQKKNIVKNSLYKDYSENYSLDFYKDLRKGFCNYNSINFFSQRLDPQINHTNCLIWPNPYADNKHLYDVYNNNLTFSFYLNLRKNYSTHNQPECILHVPRLLSLYTVRSINASNGHRICVVLGDNASKKLKDLKPSIFNSSNKNIDNQLGTYISSDLNLINNRWYNICIALNKNVDNSREIEVFIDGVSVDKIDLEFQNSVDLNHDSYICLGNKPDYLNNSDNTYKDDYNKIFYQFFGAKYNNEKPVSGPSIVKDLSLGKSSWEETGQYNIEDIIINNNAVNFEEAIQLNSESFHGEIHDLRIYTQNINEEKLENICNNTIDNVSKEIEDFNLCFYIPNFYISDYVFKRTMVNASNEKMNTYFSCLYNPYLSNTCGGLEVSSESFLLDFVNLTKPNVVIGGAEYINTHDDNSSNSMSSLVSTTNDISDIRKGILASRIYNKNISDISHEFFSVNKNNNLTYRNLLLLPNDNGIPKVNFNIINDLSSEINRSKNVYDITDYHISTDNVIDDNLHYTDLNHSLILDDNSLSFEINLANNINYDFIFTNDLLYNVSNIVYHDIRLNNMSELNISNNLFINKVDKVRNYYSFSDSNPVLRDYKHSPLSFNLNNISTIKEQDTYISDTKITYLNLLLPYSSTNLDYDCIFINIFDVSSKLYNKKLNKNSILLSDDSISSTNNNVSLIFKDDGYGSMYRADCLTKHAVWNYVGHSFYKEGIIVLNRPELSYFGQEDYSLSFETDFSMYVHEINIPAEAGLLNKSNNKTYNPDLRQDQSAFNSESSFVYITDINLHDENLNIIARAKLARPAPKKNEDSILFKLKMDY
jgi:hypothetical protein